MPPREVPFPAAGEFGRRVRAARVAKGWSMEVLAERAGLHWTYVGSVERGRRNIALLNILKLAAALDVNAAELVDGLHPD
jgi:transcriptional regulator with XRE-family HTH domain